MSENHMELLERMMEQSNAANQLLADIAKEKEHTKRVDKWMPWVMSCIMSLFSLLTIVAMLVFFSGYEFYIEETTITLDSGESEGNNIYQEGENAHYYETPKGE